MARPIALGLAVVLLLLGSPALAVPWTYGDVFLASGNGYYKVFSNSVGSTDNHS
jgi:hypothetical protein